MMQTKAKEAPDDTMGSGAMGIATTEVDGWWVGVPQLSEFISQTVQTVGFYIHVFACCYFHSQHSFIHTKL